MSSIDPALPNGGIPIREFVHAQNCCENSSSYIMNVSSDNVSRQEPFLMEYPLYLTLYFTIINCLVFVVGIGGNVMVIQVIIRLKLMRTRMNYFLMSLSFADLLVLTVCQPTAMLEFYGKDRWLLGEAMCKIVPFLEHASLHSSGLTLLVIGVERYLAICQPLKDQRNCRLANTCAVISVIWVVSYVVSLPFIFITFYEDANHIDGSTVQVCRTKSKTVWQKTYIMFVFVVLFALPLSLLVFIYGRIIGKLLRITSENQPGDYINVKTLKSRKQVINMMVAIMLLFFLCLLPLRVVILLTVFASPDTLQAMGFEAYLNLLSFVRIMMYVNSAGNPIIYGMLSSKFRVAFRRSVPHCSEAILVKESGVSTRRTQKTCMIPLNNMTGQNGTAI